MMEGIVIGVIVFLVIYALIKAWRKHEHADEIDDMLWPHGRE
jgi:predicted PurR-regulated permease PerM